MRLYTLLVLALVSVAGPAVAADPKEPATGANGLYVQPWFLESFLDLAEDAAEARGKGKRLVVLWEQKGCPYCRETHIVNFAKPEISSYIQAHFLVVQLDIYGSRKVKDFDGEELAEKDLARKHGVRFTPTIQFFPLTAAAGKQSGKDIEVARMPGYMRPFPFYTMFRYVAEEAYARQSFRDYVKMRHDESVASGGKAHTW